MNIVQVQQTCDWLLSNRQGRGWASSPSTSVESLTVTSEVVIALCEAVRAAPTMSASTRGQIEAAINGAMAYVDEAIRTREDADLDLPNVAYAVQAALESDHDVPEEFVRRCLERLDALRHKTHAGYCAKDGAEEVDTFATCLAALTLQRIKSADSANPFRSALTHDQLNDFDRQLNASVDYVTVHAPRDLVTGGWTESGPHEAPEPAITAFVLTMRVQYLLGLGLNLDTVGEDPYCRAAIEYLVQNTPTDIENYVYSMRNAIYGLFFLPYIVRSMSLLIEQLTEPALKFYYRIAEQLVGPKFRQQKDGTLLGWYGTVVRRKPDPWMWTTAHGLIGYLAVPVEQRELLEINRLRGANATIQKQLEDSERLALLGSDFSVLGFGPYRFAVSSRLLCLLVGCGLLSALGVGIWKQPQDLVRYVTLGLLFVLAAWFVYLLSPTKDKTSWRIIQSVGISLAFVAVVGTEGLHVHPPI